MSIWPPTSNPVAIDAIAGVLYEIGWAARADNFGHMVGVTEYLARVLSAMEPEHEEWEAWFAEHGEAVAGRLQSLALHGSDPTEASRDFAAWLRTLHGNVKLGRAAWPPPPDAV